jgi:hypothetical protein
LILVRWAVAPILLAVVGCGGGGEPDVTQDHRISGLVSSAAEVAISADVAKSLFAEGAAPDDAQRKRYGEYSYWATSSQVSGNQATVQVRISTPAGDKQVGEKTWTAVKVGKSWKLKDAPLPD